MKKQAYVVIDKKEKPLRIFTNAFDAIGWVESHPCKHEGLAGKIGEAHQCSDIPDKWYIVYKDVNTGESLLSIRECYYECYY